MKKLLFLVLIFIFSENAHAQLGFGPEIGFQGATASIIPPGVSSITTSSLAGGRIGGVVDIDMSQHIYLQSGAYFSLKGNKDVFKTTADSFSLTSDETVRKNYIEAPVSVLFKTGEQGTGRIFFGIGADFGFAIGGNNKFHSYGFQPVNNTIQNFDTTGSYKLVPGGYIKSFDLAVNFTAGYEFPKGVFIRVYYEDGVNNTSAQFGESDKNRVFGISAGYFFGKGRHTKIVKEPLVIKDDE